MCSRLKQAAAACEIKRDPSSEVIFQMHAVTTHNLIIDTGILQSSYLAAANTPRADLAHFVCSECAVKQAASMAGFTDNLFWNGNDA